LAFLIWCALSWFVLVYLSPYYNAYCTIMQMGTKIHKVFILPGW
jgi:hypothetical protein